MVFKSQKSNVNYDALYINNMIINKVEKTKFLGVIIDAKLNWTHHISYCSLFILEPLNNQELPFSLIQIMKLWNALINTNIWALFLMNTLISMSLPLF